MCLLQHSDIITIIKIREGKYHAGISAIRIIFFLFYYIITYFYNRNYEKIRAVAQSANRVNVNNNVKLCIIKFYDRRKRLLT